MTVDWHRFAGLVRGNQRFVLTSHIRPDCDALGSELGMAYMLRSLDKDVIIANGDPAPPNLNFIDPEGDVRVLHESVTPEELVDRDVLIVLDTSAWVQLGPMADVVRDFHGLRAVVDHHMGEDDLSAALFKDVTAEATGRLVKEAADALQVELTAEMADPLFAALATDTGWFRFNSVSARTYLLAAELLRAGANAARTYAALYEHDTAGRVRLRGIVLSRLHVECDGRFVHTFAERGDFETAGAMPSDTEDVINLTMAVAGTEVAVFFVEQMTGGTKVSFRSRCDVDVSQLAAHFGGGGHKAAAGAFIDATLAEARDLVLPYVRHLM